MGTLLLGVALELLATMLGTAGKQLVSYSARLPARALVRARRIKACGLLVTTALGPLADAMAYALAPQSLIAPLMGLDVVWNTLSAPFTLGEQLVWAHVVGTALVTSGAALTAVFGPHDKEEATLEVLQKRFFTLIFAVYCAVMFGGLCLGAYVLRRHPRGSSGTARAVALGGLAGCIAGNMSFLSAALSALSTSIQSGDWSAWATPIPYALLLVAAVVAVSNIPFMSRALQEFEALFIVTIFEGCHITVACVSGDVVNQDMRHSDWWRYCCYWLSVLTVVAGLVVIQTTAAGAIQRQEGSFHARTLPADAQIPLAVSEDDTTRTSVDTLRSMPGQGPPRENASAMPRSGSFGQVVWASSFAGLGVSSAPSSRGGSRSSSFVGTPTAGPPGAGALGGAATAGGCAGGPPGPGGGPAPRPGGPGERRPGGCLAFLRAPVCWPPLAA